MRIAQVAPLYESVPPELYGGTERVVSVLTEELVKMGHDVTLFASGDSMTAARLVPVCSSALRLDPACIDRLSHHLLLLEQVFGEKDNFDIIHFHIDYLHFPLSRREQIVNLTTLHGRLDIPDLVPLYKEYRDMPVASISNAQRRPLPWLNWQATVYHGMPVGHFPLYPKGGDYLAFLGRTSPEKGLEKAIEIARLAGMRLKIAAKVDQADKEYFETSIKPLLKDSSIEFLGEMGFPEKVEFLGNAAALLFPINWPEPFGLVMMEAMACGTPVIAFARGSVPEIMEDGVTGHIVPDTKSAARVLKNIGSFDRRSCRRSFERRFSSTRMANDYLAVYKRLIDHDLMGGSLAKPEPETVTFTGGVSVG